MKTVDCWALYTIGGAAGEHRSMTARFSSREEAEKAKPACGGYGGEIIRERVTIYDSAFEWEPKLNAAAAASGLAKLTEEERRSLGLGEVKP